MMVLVDTPLWSLALRRKKENLNPQESRLTESLAELIQQGRAQIAGPIRQEVLSGIREPEQFRRLRDYLRAFDESSLEVSDFEHAAEMHNHCRHRGIAGSATDFLICAVAARRKWQIFTTDADFVRYAKHLELSLHTVPAA